MSRVALPPGVRVLELATVVLGPLACQLLGDQGADVVKVEPPGGDSNRQVGPMRSPDMGALFLNCNRNKRGVVLDLKHAQGREAALRLAARADVLVHNYRPGALARLRLAYDDVRAVNPGIVYCGTCGYGRSGPYRGWSPVRSHLIGGAWSDGSALGSATG